MKRIVISVCLLALTALQTMADDYTRYCFKGKMGGKVSVEIAFQKFSDARNDIVAGYIYYPKAKDPAPILIVGNQLEGSYYHFNEYQPDGTITGWINLSISNENAPGGPIIDDGQWINPKTNATFSLTPLQSPFNMAGTQKHRPDWWQDDPLEYEEPDCIGSEYGYQQWNQNYQSMMGGNVTFTAAGKDKLHFEVSNCPGNIAEGSSEANRPAVLNGPQFIYSRVNECGYGFKATFFKKFVVLESVTEYETFGCFGMGTTFEGIYIKQADAQAGLSLSAIQERWQTKVIDDVPTGGLAIMLTRFDMTWPTAAVGDACQVMELGVAKKVLDDDDEYTVEVDAKNGFVESYNAGSDRQTMQACVWRRTNGHRLFAVVISQPVDPEIEFICFYDYDPQRQVLTPDPGVLGDWLARTARGNFSFRLPKEGKDLLIFDNLEQTTFRFRWDGMKFGQGEVKP
ncbi:MAG: hypothetical protein IJV45_00875 [Prevotella sp.]|nr:hypothetical protein [Prevotella sp.]